MANFPIKIGYQYTFCNIADTFCNIADTFCNIADSWYQYFWPI